MRKKFRFQHFSLHKLTTIICFLICHVAFSQSEADSALYNQSLKNVNAFYKNEIKENLHLYAGNEYVKPSALGQKVNGFPYFLSDSLLEGSIYYDGSFYNGVSIHYQIFNEKLIVNVPFYNTLIELHNEKIKFFFIGHHEFLKIPPDAASALHTNKLYYERLYSGQETLWAIREKRFILSAKAEDQSDNYFEYDQYFLEKGSAFYTVGSKKELLNALSDRKAELKKFIRQNKLKFKNETESSLIKAIQYYDQTKNF